VALRIEYKILDSSSASSCMLWKILELIKSVSWSKFSQYLVSNDSLYAMEIFEEKSAFEIAPFVSATLAPMLVPLFKNYLDSINSRFSLLKN
jgi:hypothetical protein